MIHTAITTTAGDFHVVYQHHIHRYAVGSSIEYMSMDRWSNGWGISHKLFLVLVLLIVLCVLLWKSVTQISTECWNRTVEKCWQENSASWNVCHPNIKYTLLNTVRYEKQESSGLSHCGCTYQPMSGCCVCCRIWTSAWVRWGQSKADSRSLKSSGHLHCYTAQKRPLHLQVRCDRYKCEFKVIVTNVSSTLPLQMWVHHYASAACVPLSLICKGYIAYESMWALQASNFVDLPLQSNTIFPT